MLRYFNQQQLNAFLNKIEELLFLCGKDGLLQYANESFLQKVKLPLDNLQNTALFDLFDAEDVALVKNSFNQCLLEDKPAAITVRFSRSRDYFFLWLFPVKDEHGTLTHIAGEARAQELTDEKRLQLHPGYLDFHILADNISQLAWMADAKGWIYWYNKRWFEYTGTTLQEMQGWGWTKVHHPDHVERVIKSVQHSWDTGIPWEDVFPLKSVTGEFRWFLSRAMPIKDQSGVILRWIGTNTDITEQLQAEQELVDASIRKDEFLAILGHELRNPVATLMAAVEENPLLLSREECVQMHGIMKRQVYLLKKLVDDLVDLSRLSRGKINLQKEPVNLNDVVQHCVENLLPEAKVKNQQLVSALAGAPLPMAGDIVRLQQAIGNIIHNAIKYSGDGSIIQVNTAEENDQLVFTCLDYGIGIPSEKMKFIFEPFTQLDDSAVHAETGMGIGLSLVKQLVELHNGSVQVESAGKNAGSKFTVRFPLKKELNIDAKEEEDKPLPRVQKKILLAEDNEDLAHLLTRQFEKAGHEVVAVVSNGQLVADTIEKHQPNIVFIDIGLPGKDGYAVAAELAGYPFRQHLKLIGMSGYNPSEEKLRLFDKFLLKPVQVNKLLLLLSEA